MDRVDFSEARFRAIATKSRRISIDLGVTPTAVIPMAARDGDGVAERTRNIAWYNGPDRGRGDRRADAGAAARTNCRCGCRCRRSTSSTIAASSPAASNPAICKTGDEIVIMPAGKIAKIKTVEGWPVTPISGPQGAGRSVGITLDRELFIERGDVIGHVGSAPRDTGGCMRGSSGCITSR